MGDSIRVCSNIILYQKNFEYGYVPVASNNFGRNVGLLQRKTVKIDFEVKSAYKNTMEFYKLIPFIVDYQKI